MHDHRAMKRTRRKGKNMNRKLTAEELAALQTFAAEYGREWKQYLVAAWMSESHRGLPMGGKDSGILRCIRNEFGNTWLHKFKLPKPETAGR
jgi:hypothetical protein